MNAFQEAVTNQDRDAVNALIANGNIPNTEDDCKALIEYADSGILDALRQVGYRLDYDCHEMNNIDPVWDLMDMGAESLLATLVSMGLDIESDQQGLDYQTYMGIAATAGREDIIELLLNIGIDPTIGNRAKHGQTPLDIAKRDGRDNIVQMITDAIDMNDDEDITDPMDMGCELYTRMGRGNWELVGPFANTEEAIYQGRKIQQQRPELAFRVRNDDNEETAFEDAID